jgi:hypothetical protein
VRRLHLWTALACVLGFASSGALRAQGGGTSAAETAEAFAAAWGRGDAGGLQALMSPTGLRMRIDGRDRGGVSARQASAALRTFLARHELGEVSARRIEVLGGDPPRGLAELDWRTRSEGARETVAYVIFLGLKRAGDRWLVTEIRILP